MDELSACFIATLIELPPTSIVRWALYHSVFISFQITWARLEDERRPYSVLTIGDSNYVEDKRFIVLKPRKNQDVSSESTIQSVKGI